MKNNKNKNNFYLKKLSKLNNNNKNKLHKEFLIQK